MTKKEVDRIIAVDDPNQLRWKHFKGNIYRTKCYAEHSETGDLFVVYYKEDDKYQDHVYVRPADMFLSKVDKEKYPDVEQEYRFELVEE